MKRSRKLLAAWDFNQLLKDVPAKYNVLTDVGLEEATKIIVKAVHDLEWPYAWPKSVRPADVPPCPWTILKQCPDAILYSADVLNAFKSKLSDDEWKDCMMDILTSTFVSGDYRHNRVNWFGPIYLDTLTQVGLMEAIVCRMSIFDEWVEKCADKDTAIAQPHTLLKFLCRNHQQVGVRLELYIKLISYYKPEYRHTYLKWVEETMNTEEYISFLEAVCCSKLPMC